MFVGPASGEVNQGVGKCWKGLEVTRLCGHDIKRGHESGNGRSKPVSYD